MKRLVLIALMCAAAPAWAEPAAELKTCQEVVSALTVQVQQERQNRVGYVVQLAEMLGEVRQQLQEHQGRIQALTRELQQLKFEKSPLEQK